MTALKLLAAQDSDDKPEIMRLARAFIARRGEAALNLDEAPYLAAALALAGDTATARAIIAPTPVDCDACTRARGRIATADRRWAEADRWFARTTAAAPSIPTGWSDWGESRLARGDLDGAIDLFRKAQKTGPRWADPLKFEGDALMRQGKAGAAARRYQKAAERAPRWVALHLAWADALDKAGRSEEARARRRAALTMSPTPAEQAQIAGRA